jgi:hypothetical protein
MRNTYEVQTGKPEEKMPHEDRGVDDNMILKLPQSK